MKYTTMMLPDFEAFFQAWRKRPFCTRVSLLCEKGVMMVAPSENEVDTSGITRPYKIVITHHAGGPIIGFDDGVTLICLSNQKPHIDWPVKLAAYLKEKGLNAEYDGGKHNDVTVDGFKVAGFGIVPIPDTDYLYHGIHVSINADADEINRICKKPMKKVPKGLSEYGITREEIIKCLDVEETMHG